jgi:DNA primase
MQNSAVVEIKEKLSIEEVVSSYVKLQKTGINLKACCPFHNEKTPSFFVSPDRGSFYCFGCSKGGDIFTFVQEIEGVDFKESLKILAEKAGVDVSKYKFEKTEKVDDSLYTIQEKATLFFERELNKHDKAKEYLKARGISGASARKWRLGYAKDEWQSLYDYMKDEKHTDEQILATGLVIKNENGRIYDRFRGRVIFPIFDEKGRTIAYSARILTDAKDQPKYINSPETALFNKSKTLYGFSFAKQTIRKHDFAILMEGQMDVIMVHQLGYTNAVASSGTSFTEDQLKIIKRHTNNLLIAFDADVAGLKSSQKVWEMALENEMDVKIIPLKVGQDPADIASSNPDEWKKLVKSSRHIIEHLGEHIGASFEDKRKKQKEVQKEIYPYLRKIRSMTDKSFFVEKLSEMFGIDKDAMWADINAEEEVEIQPDDKDKEIKQTINPREVLYGIFLKNENKEFLSVIEKYVSKDLQGEMDKRKDKILFSVEALLEQHGDVGRMADSMMTRLRMSELELEKEGLNEELKKVKEGTQEEAKVLRNMEKTSREIENVKKHGCQDLLNML